MKPSQLTQALKFLVRVKQPMMVWGPPGVGKSDVMRNVVALLNKEDGTTDAKPAKTAKPKTPAPWEFRDIRLLNSDPTDLKGFPMPNQATKTMDFFPMALLPTSGRGLLFLDEINAAPSAVQAGAYQLVLDRKLGDYVLPEGWSVACAGNRSTDRSVVHAMPAALCNRLIHLDYTVDFEEWVDWAIANKISDTTRAYLRMQPNDLCVDKIEAGVRAFNTPRTWAFADKVIDADLPIEVKLPILSGTLGEGIATKVMGFIRDRRAMPNLDKILLDPDSVPVPESPSIRYAVLAGLEARVNANNFERVLKYVKRMSKDFEVVFVTAADRRDPEISETKIFTEWIRENRSVLV